MNKQLSLPDNVDFKARYAFLLATATAAAHFVAVLYYLYLGRTTGAPQFYALAAISLALGMLIGFGAVVSRRGQPTMGLILTLGSMALSYPPVSATLVGGLGLVLGLALMVIGPMSAFQVLPRRLGWVTTILTFLSGLATLLLDVFGSAARPSLPGIVIQLLAASVVGITIYFIVRQFRDYSLRTKVTGGFILFSLVMGVISFVLVQRALQPITEDTIPTVAEDGQLHQLFIEVQAESALFISGGDATHLEHLSSKAVELETLAELFKTDRADDPGEVEMFTRVAQIARQISETAQSAAESHTSTLEHQEALQGLEEQAQSTFIKSQGIINDEITRNIQAGDLEELRTDSLQSLELIGRFIIEVQNLQVEANQYVTLSNEETLQEFEAAEIRLEEIQSNLALILESSEPGEGDLVADLNEIEEKIETTSRQIIDSRDQTLTYIGQMEVLAEEFDLVSVQVDQIIDEEISNTTTRALTNSSLISLAVSILAALLGYGLASMIARPISQLVTAANQIAEGDLAIQAEANSRDEIGTLASAFNTMTSRLRDNISSLENRVAERTRNLELAAEVGRSVSQVRELHLMLKDAAEIIRSRFDLYYAQVYLTNPAQNALILQAGTGAVGTELLSRAHQLPLNTASINGRAAMEKRPVVISDTAASATFKPNPLLPDTRSEMAVPLLVGEKVVGVLDLQSQMPDTLNQDILPAFEALAGQLAIAIQNANLLAEADQARADVEIQARRLVRKNWDEHLDAIHQPEQTGFVFEGSQVTSLADPMDIQIPADGNTISAPIAITGEPLGTLVVEMDAQNLTPQNTELVNIIARQVAQQVESLRLLDTAERYRFEAEQAARRITREGWKDYMQAKADEGLSYVYDLTEVRPSHGNGAQPSEESPFSLPLKVRDETVGKLVIQGLEADDSESLNLANAVAERLGAHIEGLRQFEETKRGQMELDKRAQQLAAVAEISSVSSRELDIQKMLESVVNLTQRKFGLYHAHIFTFNENSEELKIAACGWKEGDEHEGTHGTAIIPINQEQSLVARAARTRQAVIVNDVLNEPGWLPNPLLPDTASELAVPLVIGDQLLGVLDVQSDLLNAFTEEDANIQTTLASQVATALQNARSFVKAQQQAERESTLNVIGQKIQSATSVESVLQIAARELGRALGAPLTIAQLGIRETSDNGGNHR